MEAYLSRVQTIDGARAVNILNHLSEFRGLPEVITRDNVPEFTDKAQDEWAYRTEVKLYFIRPRKPVENDCLERGRRSYRGLEIGLK